MHTVMIRMVFIKLLFHVCVWGCVCANTRMCTKAWKTPFENTSSFADVFTLSLAHCRHSVCRSNNGPYFVDEETES